MKHPKLLIPLLYVICQAKQGCLRAGSMKPKRFVTSVRHLLTGNHRQRTAEARHIWKERSKIKVQVKIKAAIVNLSLDLSLLQMSPASQGPSASQMLRSKHGFFMCLLATHASSKSSLSSPFLASPCCFAPPLIRWDREHEISPFQFTLLLPFVVLWLTERHYW